MSSDAELISEVLQGHTEAFGPIVARYQRGVYGLALGYLKDFDTAYDAAQEVFLHAFLKLDQLETPGKLPSWLWAITANVCKTWRAGRHDQIALEYLEQEETAAEYPAPAERPDRAFEQQEDRRLVLRALEKLSAEHRQVLTLYYLGQRSTVEVAALLATSPDTVRQRLHRARRQLKKEMLTMLSDTLQHEGPGEGFSAEVAQLLDKVKTLFQRAEYRQAVPALERAQRLIPEDTLVALLLADAYTWGLNPQTAEAEPRPYERAFAVLDRLIARDPGNLLARIKRAELRSVMAPFAQVLAEHEENLLLAQGGPFESWALLRLARLHNARGHREEAKQFYQRLIEREPLYTGIVCQELAVSHFLGGDLLAAITSLEQGIAFLREQSPESFAQHSRHLTGRQYGEFWDGSDNQPSVGLYQAHAWLAGICMKQRESQRAREHLAAAIGYLDRKELASVRPVLVQELLQWVQVHFPELQEEPMLERVQ